MKKRMARRKERKGNVKMGEENEENDIRSKNLTVVTSSPQLDVVVSREFNPSGNAGLTNMMLLILMSKKI